MHLHKRYVALKKTAQYETFDLFFIVIFYK